MPARLTLPPVSTVKGTRLCWSAYLALLVAAYSSAATSGVVSAPALSYLLQYSSTKYIITRVPHQQLKNTHTCARTGKGTLALSRVIIVDFETQVLIIAIAPSPVP
jgi:hypothetical protein